MELPEHLKDKTPSELEEWFVEALYADPSPLEDMLALLKSLKDSESVESAREWAGMMQEELKGPEHSDVAIRLLSLRLLWEGDVPEFRKGCKRSVMAVLPGRLGTAQVKSAGFDRDDLPLEECLRRLRVLTSLKEGVLCHDKTWGFGVVKRLDDFHKKITIDFDSRSGHAMSFEYAGETLELIDEHHLMARRYNNREELDRLVQEDAGLVVKIALESYGPMSAPDLQDRLVPAVVSESDWKRFWASARKVLKADPLVELPAKRNDLIRLRASEKEYGDQWFRELGMERDIDRIVEDIVEWERESDGIDSITAGQRGALGDRIAFSIRGSEWQKPGRVAWFVMLSKRLGFSELPNGDGDSVSRPVDIDETTRRLLEPELFVAVLTEIAARDIEPFMTHMAEYDDDTTCSLLIAVLDRLPLPSLKAALDMLVARSRESDCRERLKSLFYEQQVGPTLVHWACSNLDQVARWEIIDMPNLLAVAVDRLGGDHSGIDLKACNQLESLFEDMNWLEAAFGEIDGEARRSFLKRIQNMRGIDAVQRRSIMARIIKLFPELEHTLEGATEDTATSRRVRYTSWRSYNRRREELKNLEEVLIPANSREIAVARSYGDLSENHEYKAAKEHQGILLRRKEELGRDLREVQGTDFSGFTAEKAGIGTCVDVKRPDGSSQRFCILGEWDGDVQLGIISSQSRLAQLLEGAVAGDEVKLPVPGAVAGSDDEETCVVTSVSPPDDSVAAYLDDAHQDTGNRS